MTGAGAQIPIPAGEVSLQGMIGEPPAAGAGIVVFVHGSGSSRHSPRNQMVAQLLRDAGLGTLLFDLLTPEEEQVDMVTRHLRFDIELLTERLLAVTDWLIEQRAAQCPIGYIGSSTGAAAALIAAARTGHPIHAVVSRGGRPDLAGEALGRVRAATLLVVGGYDFQVLELNQLAFDKLDCEKHLAVVPGATHLFGEPGKLEEAAALARDWFLDHLPSAGALEVT